MTTILIAGGGYAGITCANRLAAKTGHEILLADPADGFCERTRLHELIAGVRDPASVTTPYGQALDRRVRHIRARVEHAGDDGVLLGDGTTLHPDHTVIATGSGGAGGYGTLSGAGAIREQTAVATTVEVVGAGHSGVEIASEIADHNPAKHVRLVAPNGVLPAMSERAQAYATDALERLGVEIAPSSVTKPVPIQGNVTLDGAGETETETETVRIDCTGFRTSAPAGVPLTPEGRIVVEPALRVHGTNTLWAAGDVAASSLRMGCATGIPTAAYAADNIARACAGRTEKPIDIGYLAQGVSLGRRDAIIEFVHRDDSPSGRVLTGRPAALFKETLLRGARLIPTRFANMYTWVKAAPVAA